MAELASGKYAIITGAYEELAETKLPILIMVILNE